MLKIFLDATKLNCLLVIFSVFFIFSQNSSRASVIDTVKVDFKYAFADAKYLVTNIDCHTGLFAAGSVFGSYLATRADADLKVNKKDAKNIPWMKAPGEVYTAIALPSAIYLTGLIIEDGEIRTTGRLLFEAMALSGATNYCLKFALGRARPYMNQGNMDFRLFESQDKYQSMPSGHTCAAFTSASLLAARIDKAWAYLAFYSWAGLTGYERIRENKHWFSDVCLGAAIGVFSSYSVLNANSKNNNEQNIGRFSLSPYYNGVMINYSYSF
jgi:membrane-associated phospholipid phosphatase